LFSLANIAVAWSVRRSFGFQLAAFPLTLNPSPLEGLGGSKLPSPKMGEGLGVRVRTLERKSVSIRLSNAIVKSLAVR